MGNGIIPIIDAAFQIVTRSLIPLAFGLCLLYFFWGMVKYIRSGAEGENAAKEGRSTMVWGVVGLFVAFSIWGIITFIQEELGIPPIERVNIESANSNVIY